MINKRRLKKLNKKIYIKKVLFKESYYIFPIKYFYFYQKLLKKYGDDFDKTIIKLWGVK